DVAALELIGRSESDRVHENVEAVPTRRERIEERVDLAVVGDVERQRDIAFELRGESADPVRELLRLIAECELGAFAPHRLCDTPAARSIAGGADDQGPLAGQETHACPLLVAFVRRDGVYAENAAGV